MVEVVHKDTRAELTLAERRGIALVSLRGEADLANVDKIESALAAISDDTAGVVIDLREADFIDSSMVSILFDLRVRLRRRRRKLRVAAADGSPIRRVLELTGFDRQTPIDPSAEAALEALSAESAR